MINSLLLSHPDVAGCLWHIDSALSTGATRIEIASRRDVRQDVKPLTHIIAPLRFSIEETRRFIDSNLSLQVSLFAAFTLPAVAAESVGQAASDAATKTGQAVARAGRETGHAAAEAGRETASAVKKGGRKAKAAAKAASETK
jgi:hypothetical protein